MRKTCRAKAKMQGYAGYAGSTLFKTDNLSRSKNGFLWCKSGYLVSY